MAAPIRIDAKVLYVACQSGILKLYPTIGSLSPLLDGNKLELLLRILLIEYIVAICYLIMYDSEERIQTCQLMIRSYSSSTSLESPSRVPLSCFFVWSAAVCLSESSANFLRLPCARRP